MFLCWQLTSPVLVHDTVMSIVGPLIAIGSELMILVQCPKEGKHPRRTRENVETELQKKERFQHAATRKIRKLSGWNVYLRHELQGQSTDTTGYTQRVKECSAAWKRMPADDKAAFEVEAVRQNLLRDQLAEIPLSSGPKASSQNDLETEVGRKGCKALSARRLVLNHAQFQQHPIWNLPTSFGDRSWDLTSGNL